MKNHKLKGKTHHNTIEQMLMQKDKINIELIKKIMIEKKTTLTSPETKTRKKKST